MPLRDGQWFKASDLACHDGTPYPETWVDRWERLITLLDAIRSLWGGPLFVVSGYRTPAHNDELIRADAMKGAHGVASGSYHITGDAADLRTSRWQADVPHLLRVVLTAQEDGKLPLLGGVGDYPQSGWLHIDCHKVPDGHLRRWRGL